MSSQASVVVKFTFFANYVHNKLCLYQVVLLSIFFEGVLHVKLCKDNPLGHIDKEEKSFFIASPIVDECVCRVANSLIQLLDETGFKLGSQIP